MDGIIFIKGEIGTEYTYSHALIDLEKNKSASVLKIYIDSPGGSFDEGMKIYDLLRTSGKMLITENSGIIASMGVTLFLLAPKGSRFYDPKKGEFFIHNPWGEPSGDADFLLEASKQMKKVEKQLVSIYSQATQSMPETIAGLMSIQSSLTPDQVETLGFAKIINNELKAVAKLNYDQMTNEELNTKIEQSSAGIFAKMKEFFKKMGVIKAFVLQTGDGKTLDFGEEIQDASQIAVGLAATVEGKPAEGSFLMPDGVTLVFVAGKVTEIMPVMEESAELTALKAENETLKADNVALKTQVTDAKALVTSIEVDFKAFKTQVTSDIKGLKPTLPVENQETTRKPFKTK
jgi:ATP-dependent protease ClpP protease subunit